MVIAGLFVSSRPAAKIAAFLSASTVNTVLLALEGSLMRPHLGVMVTEAEIGKLLAEQNSHKNFVPASITKLPRMYAGLKYLPDTLIALRYDDGGDTIYAQPTGDLNLLVSAYHSPSIIRLTNGS
ncbi:MAG: hypothetical protein EAY75_06265 [Bacteroidetes bacterium]|nr:MAG: hypothetical protein EAY75_06265 [Bacteroidota bacterium]